MKKLTLLILTLMILALGGCSGHRNDGYIPATDMKKVTLAYASYAGVESDLTSMDIYYKDDDENHPVMVFIHGGALRKGDKGNPNHQPKANYFVNQGYVFVSLNYRLAPEMVYPEALQDVAAALAMIHDEIDIYGGNHDDIYLMGHSAGAYLTALISVNESYLHDVGGSLEWIRGSILLDTETLIELPEWVLVTIPDESLIGEATPFHHLTNQKNIPPQLIILHDGHSEEGTLMYLDKLTSIGFHGGYVHSKGDNHDDISLEIGMIDDEKTALIMAFINHPTNVVNLTSDLGHLLEND